MTCIYELSIAYMICIVNIYYLYYLCTLNINLFIELKLHYIAALVTRNFHLLWGRWGHFTYTLIYRYIYILIIFSYDIYVCICPNCPKEQKAN